MISHPSNLLQNLAMLNSFRMKIYIGTDHRGFKLKKNLKTWLTNLGHEVIDNSNETFDPGDDYADFAITVAKNVSGDSESRGIVMCGSGVGVNIAANKIKGVRCSLGFDPNQVKNGREDEDINILAIAVDYTGEEPAKALILSFLDTKFVNVERHVRRLEKITQYD